ncbi:MAG TPA: ferredoxin [Sphingobacteriaceae bacterium]
MADTGKNIQITIFYDGQTHIVRTYPNEYRNLMMLIYDKICIEDFGDCLGMGKCGTCLIEIIGAHDELTSFDRNEETTIAKAGIEGKNLRLACQILIDHHLNGLQVNVK